jgi:hypothetical protein
VFSALCTHKSYDRSNTPLLTSNHNDAYESHVDQCAPFQHSRPHYAPLQKEGDPSPSQPADKNWGYAALREYLQPLLTAERGVGEKNEGLRVPTAHFSGHEHVTNVCKHNASGMHIFVVGSAGKTNTVGKQVPDSRVNELYGADTFSCGYRSTDAAFARVALPSASVGMVEFVDGSGAVVANARLGAAPSKVTPMFGAIIIVAVVVLGGIAALCKYYSQRKQRTAENLIVADESSDGQGVCDFVPLPSN